MNENHTTKGAALIISSSLIYCLMGAMVKYASHIDSYTVTLFRFVIGLAILGSAAMSGRIKLNFVHNWLLFFRGLIGCTAVFIFFLSIAKIGLGKATVIGYMFPIFATILSAIFLREKITLKIAVAVLTAFLGIYLLTAGDNAGHSFFKDFGKYEALAILGAFLGGTAIVIIRKLHSTDSAYAIFFAQCTIGIWLMIMPANMASTKIGFSGVILLLCIGLTAAIGQLMMTQGYKYLNVATGSLLGMLTPAINFIIGLTIFKEATTPTSIIGAIIVVASCTIVLSAKNKS
ncbi:DMT family transporter [Planctomycetota bacterium]